jgi:hypothetical protein
MSQHGLASEPVGGHDGFCGLAARLASVKAELEALKVHVEALESQDGPLRREILHPQFVALFRQPITLEKPRILVPFEELSPGIEIGLEPDAGISLIYTAAQPFGRRAPFGALIWFRS